MVTLLIYSLSGNDASYFSITTVEGELQLSNNYPHQDAIYEFQSFNNNNTNETIFYQPKIEFNNGNFSTLVSPILSSAGELKLEEDADHSLKSEYNFDIVATSGELTTLYPITVKINDPEEISGIYKLIDADLTPNEITNGLEVGITAKVESLGETNSEVTYSIVKDPVIVTPTTYSSLSSGFYAGIKEDGSVLTWGPEISEFYPFLRNDPSTVAKELSGNIDAIDVIGNSWGFAALLEDGSAVTWGSENSEPYPMISDEIDIVKIVSSSSAFAFLKEDGSVVTQGIDSSNLASQLSGEIKVVEIISNNDAFAF